MESEVGEKLFQTKLLTRLAHKFCRFRSSPVLLRKFTKKNWPQFRPFKIPKFVETSDKNSSSKIMGGPRGSPWTWGPCFVHVRFEAFCLAALMRDNSFFMQINFTMTASFYC